MVLTPSTQAEPQKTMAVQAQPKFTFEEDQASEKEIFLIYGEKGSGKTSASFLFPGKIACLSFDRKSSIIKKNFFKNDERIKVYDAVKYWCEAPEEYTESSKATYDYVVFLLNKIETEIKPDYILIDGLEILEKIAEMIMRSNNRLKPFQGISNMNVWKERQLLVRNIHNRALRSCNKGIIYTCYIKQKEIVEEGTTISKKDMPKWTDIIVWQTDCVIRVENEPKKEGGRKFIARIDNSKVATFNTGDIIDITDKKEWKK